MTPPPKALARYRSPGSSRLLAHLLEEPELVTLVRRLEAPALGRLIDTLGLEGSGELVALATTEQLRSVFDADLWRADSPGDDERFDPERFGLWLQVLLEAGEDRVVDRLCELPLDLVTLGFHRLIFVIDVDAWAATLSEAGEDSDLTEKALDSFLYEEWEEFRMMSRDAACWDSALSALLALDRDHHDRLRQILERCAFMSQELIDDQGGLYEVLTSDEMLENDTRAERDDRRAEVGYVTPADARAFLSLARAGLAYPEGTDPLTRAYFRELASDAKQAKVPFAGTGPRQTTAPIGKLERLLAEVDPDVPQPMGAPAPRRELSIAVRQPRAVDQALRELEESHPDVYAQRLEELSYLANVLVAGYARGARRLRPVEASEAALAIVQLGLERVLPHVRPRPGSELRELWSEVLLRVPAHRLFRVAWREVHDRPELWSPALEGL